MAGHSVALVTPSYPADMQRCQLLCDSVDARVEGMTHHYILVADDDHRAFAHFDGPRRTVVRESDVLPERFWTVATPGGRPAWLSAFALPLRGWHMQQLRRISLARHVDADALLYCDSDMAFVRTFDVSRLWQGNALRLYRQPGAISGSQSDMIFDHRKWVLGAHRLHGLAPPAWPAADYINNLVSWKRHDVLAMMDNIENVTGRPWLRAITARRAFSECQIYGAYIDGVRNTEGHWTSDIELSRTLWEGKRLDGDGVASFIEDMNSDQVAIGIQSFIKADAVAIRRMIGL